MADTPDTPETPKPAKPATTRRRAPRKSAPAKRPAKPARETATAAAPTKRAAPPKPRSTNRATPPTAKRPPAAAAATPTPSPAPTTAKPARNWRPAAIAGGIAALGAAATAALLTLRGSTPRPKRAHTPDGRDASKSFDAGIADENSIPDGN